MPPAFALEHVQISADRGEIRIRGSLRLAEAAVAGGAGLILLFLLVKMASKYVGVKPLASAFRFPPREAMYTTLLMSTGLTFGSISALYGLTHGIIGQDKYTVLVTVVILSALVPLFHYALRPGGYLLLGPSESLAAYPELFVALDKKHRLFRRSDSVVRPRVEFPLSGRAGPQMAQPAAPSQSAAPTPPRLFNQAFERMVLEEYAPPPPS